MSDLERRWTRLVEAARQTPAPGPKPIGSDWVARVAHRGLVARIAPAPRPREPLAWAGLAAFATAAATVVLLWPGPIADAASAVTARMSSLPHALPRAPRLPPAARPVLPPARDALAALPRIPELTLDLPFTSRRTDTP